MSARVDAELRIIFAAAEMAPFAKVGGLADVVGSLPQALERLGHEVAAYLPLHGSIDRARHAIGDGRTRDVAFGGGSVAVTYHEVVHQGVRVIFVDSERIAREKPYGFDDDGDRYALFCHAVADDLANAPEPPDVVHAHDWHAGLLNALIAERLPGTATVFTIHNLAYQGPGDPTPMAQAIRASDLVSTVSPRYAQEILTPEFGERLDPLLNERRADLVGIVNGIDTDVFDPSKDPAIAAHYSASDRAGKAVCKAALQRESGLAEEADTPVFGVIGRLVEQKGVDLLTAVAPDILANGQIVVLGSGEPGYEERWRALAAEHRGRLALTLGFDSALAQRIYAGVDLFLMPSRFEPCGLGQLISLRYGTIPVVRAVGGLADTVRDHDTDPATGNGFSFSEYTAAAFSDAIARAVRTYRRRDAWDALRERAMLEDHSWTASATEYVAMYRRATAKRKVAA